MWTDPETGMSWGIPEWLGVKKEKPMDKNSVQNRIEAAEEELRKAKQELANIESEKTFQVGDILKNERTGRRFIAVTDNANHVFIVALEGGVEGLPWLGTKLNGNSYTKYNVNDIDPTLVRVSTGL